MDRVLAEALGNLCACLIMDGEGCNQMIRRIIHGDMDPDLRRRVQNLRFFSRLRFQPLALDWPRVPMQLCTIDQEPLFAIVGPAHTMKNSAGQLQSHVRSIFCGDYFADLSGSLPHGIPWPAFQRKDPMSDRLCSLLCSPQYLIVPVVAWLAFHSVDSYEIRTCDQRRRQINHHEIVNMHHSFTDQPEPD